MAWMPLVTMGLLLVALLAFPQALKSPWGLVLIPLVAVGCPAMCFGAMALQALAGRR